MNNRTLGTIAMLCAPALLVEALLTVGRESSLIVGTASMIFMAGSLPARTPARELAWPAYWLWGPGLTLGLALLPLYFPDGRLVSPR